MAETPSARFLEFFEKWVPERSYPRILEIGGGAKTFVKHPNAQYTVLEVTPEALETNSYASERLLGDAQTFDFSGKTFDVVVFWNVLEHIESPLRAIQNACSCLETHGLLVVRGPELRSLKSIIARVTPHFVHVYFYRWVLKHPGAGQRGHAPFPIEHSTEADITEIDKEAERLSLRCIFKDSYVGDQVHLLAEHSKISYYIYKSAEQIIRTLTFGRWCKPNTEFVRVYRLEVLVADI